MSDLRSFSAPTRIVAGLGAASSLRAELEALGPGRLAVVCDAGVAEAGILDEVTAPLAGIPRVDMPLVRPDPLVADVEAAADAARAAGCDAVLGVGGGSALAVAKAVALLLRNDSPVGAYAGWNRAPSAPVPTVAIPTTAGSGSEVSNALVLHDPAQDVVVVVRGHGYEPRVALLDGLLLRGLPERPLLDAALDALSHALEALWARGASSFTDALAVAAADRLHEVLPRVLAERRDGDLQALLEASTTANLACGSSGLALCHAFATTARVRVPHGRVNGVLLPWVADFNAEALRPVARREAERLHGLFAKIGFEPSFAKGELDGEDAAAMERVALGSPLHLNNARHADAAQLAAILARAGAPAAAGRGEE